MRSTIFLSLAATALAAPYPQAGVLGKTDQVGGAVGAVAATVNGAVNAAVNAVDVKADNNNILNYALDNNNVNVLRRDGAAVNGATGQVGSAVGGLVGAAGNVAANVGADVADVNVECNDIGNDVLNGNNISILKREVDAATNQVSGALGGLAGVAASVTGNVDAVVGKVTAEYNNIGNDVLNGNNVNVLKRQADVSALTKQFTDAVGAIAAALGLDVNAAVNAVNVAIKNNNILNDALNNNNVNILKRQADVDALTKQLASAVGAIAASLGLDANAAVEAVNVAIKNNNILNVLNGNNVNVLKRDGAAVVAPTAQASSALAGLIVAAVNALANAAVQVGKVTVTGNEIANNVGNGNNVNVLRDLAAVTGQKGAAIGGLAGVNLLAVVNAVLKALNVNVIDNNILNNVLNANDISILDLCPAN